jgi:hypothetical protein
MGSPQQKSAAEKGVFGALHVTPFDMYLVMAPLVGPGRAAASPDALTDAHAPGASGRLLTFVVVRVQHQPSPKPITALDSSAVGATGRYCN